MDADEVRQALAQHTDKILCTRELLGRRDNDRHEIIVPPDTPDDMA